MLTNRLLYLTQADVATVGLSMAEIIEKEFASCT